MNRFLSKIAVLMLMCVACSQLVFTDRMSEFERLREQSLERAEILEAKLNKLSFEIQSLDRNQRVGKRVEQRFLREQLEAFEKSLAMVEDVDSEALYRLQKKVPQTLDNLEEKIDAAFVREEV